MGLLERIYHFHEELTHNRYPNATSLVHQFEVSLATARRDISYLRDRLLAPIAFDQLKNGFYYTEEGFGLPFEKSPKIVFLLGMLSKMADEAGLGSVPEVQALERRLGELVFPEYSRLIEAIHCEWVEVEVIDPAIFETIIEATVKKRVLSADYRSSKGRQSQRELEPLRLISYQGRWYLLAYCRLRLDIRLFHIARITSALLQRESFKRSSDDNFDAYLNSAFGIFKGEVIYTATILFISTAAELVRYQRWHRDQVIEETEEGVLLHLPVSDDREIVMKTLQYGAMAKVIAPEELKQRVQNEAEGVAALYRK
ncbi:MAG TPA: WYL domain-containing protein [Desulfopila sp.]|nr:WYL domain-containing protein [Desulfopila sp.]